MSRNHIYAENELQLGVDHTLSYNHGPSRRSRAVNFWHLRYRGIDSECLEIISGFLSKIIPLCGGELWHWPSLLLNTVYFKKKLESFAGKVVAVFGDPEQNRKNDSAPPKHQITYAICTPNTRKRTHTFSQMHFFTVSLHQGKSENTPQPPTPQSLTCNYSPM